jgi:hypothetical protein
MRALLRGLTILLLVGLAYCWQTTRQSAAEGVEWTLPSPDMTRATCCGATMSASPMSGPKIPDRNGRGQFTRHPPLHRRRSAQHPPRDQVDDGR